MRYLLILLLVVGYVTDASILYSLIPIVVLGYVIKEIFTWEPELARMERRINEMWFEDNLPPRLEMLERCQSDPYAPLSAQTGLSSEELGLTPLDYETVSIPKKTGGYRYLSIPNSRLKSVQSKLVEHIAEVNRNRVHHCCHSYRKNRSIVTNAIPHLSCEVLLKLDIKDYFANVKKEHLEKHVVLYDLDRYNKENLEAYLGTDAERDYISTTKKLHTFFSNKAAYQRIYEFILTDDGLPQGAPSSPILSNLILREFDQEVFLVTRSLGGTYTRYSDDMTISFQEDDSQKIAQTIKFIEGKLRDYGFSLNKRKGKLQILRKHQAQRICGVTINSGKPTISRKQRRLIRAAAHNADLGREVSFTESQVKGHQSFHAYVARKGDSLVQKRAEQS